MHIYIVSSCNPLRCFHFGSFALICKIYLTAYFILRAETQTVTTPVLHQLSKDISTKQAIGSFVNASVNVTVFPAIPSWSFSWKFNGILVGHSGVNKFLHTVVVPEQSKYSNRISISNFPTRIAFTNQTYTSVITLQNLTENEAGLTFDISLTRKSNSFVTHSSALKVQACQQNVSSFLVVQSIKNTFGANGQFSCHNNGMLFYSNGTKLQTNQTTCLASATWHGQDSLQCWKAPQVTLNGIFTVAEGEKLTLICDYQDVFPSGTSYLFYKDNMVVVESQSKIVSLSSLSNHNDDKKEIYCQVVTPFTRIHNESGRSLHYILDVQYRLTDCTWTINQSGSCDVVFQANPTFQFVNLLKNGTTVSNDDANTIFVGGNGYHKFTFKRNYVTNSDFGTYALILASSAVATNQTVNFTINMVNSLVAGVNYTIIIAVGCCAVVLFILLLFLLIIWMKRKCNHKKDTTVPPSQETIQCANPRGSYLAFQPDTLHNVKKPFHGNSTFSNIPDFNTKELPIGDENGYVDMRSQHLAQVKSCEDEEGYLAPIVPLLTEVTYYSHCGRNYDEVAGDKMDNSQAPDNREDVINCDHRYESVL